jgi:predicted DNA-binding transcriptional regulator AlpA
LPDPTPATLDALLPVLARLADALAESAGIVPEAMNGADAAKFCGLSTSKFYDANSRGMVPSPVQVDGVARWLRAELAAWLRAGCPPRVRWQCERDAVFRRAS